jgi:signal transduction histidine kinase
VQLGDLVERVRRWLWPGTLPSPDVPADQPQSKPLGEVSVDPATDVPAADLSLAAIAADEPADSPTEAPAAPWPVGLDRVAQELRTSLSVIDGFSALLLQETVGPLNALQRDFLRTIQQEGTRMATRVQALAGETLEAGEPELPDFPVQPLGPIVRELVARLEPLSFRKAVQLQTDLPTDLPPVGVASSQLRHLLESVLDHAIAEGAAAGRLVVRARAIGAEVEICVEANGSTRDQTDGHSNGRIVGPSVLESEERPGLGPSLAACRQIVEQHGGRIWIERSPERGDRLLCTLPAVHEPARRVAVGAGW